MRIALIALAITLISACSAVGFPGVYRIDVEQGNIMEQEKIDQLKPGMSRRQVRFILGTPLLEDSFNNERWDYTYVKRNGLDVISQSHLSVLFEGDALQEVRGDVVPAAWGGAADAASDATPESSGE